MSEMTKEAAAARIDQLRAVMKKIPICIMSRTIP
mgnify:CR=1 FL=1